MNDDLTNREEEIIELISKGMSTEDIAARLWIAAVTVRNHVANILTKLGVNTRGAAVYAWQGYRANSAARVLAYCKRSRIPLADLQRALIKAAFESTQVACVGNGHIFPVRPDGETTACLCGAIRVKLP